MLSFRAIVRAVPKATFRPTSIRYVNPVLPGYLRPTLQAWKRPSFPAFSTSLARREPAGEADLELSEKFNLERQLELDSRDPSKLPASVEDFLNNSQFKVQDKQGTHEVTLTRDFGNENIKVEFSIADMNQIQEDDYDQMEDDTALEDEADFEPPKRTINQSGSKGGKIDVAAEDSIAPADRAEEEATADSDTEFPASYPLNLIITITKPGNAAVEIRANAQDGAIEIESVNYFPRADLADAKTPEDARESRTVYAGPPFGNLDPDLQAMMEAYLEERGINAQLAAFLPEYVDYKEQREYVQWLANMKSFIDT